MPTDLENSVRIVGEAWKQSAYYDDAESWTWMFWDQAHPFRPWFDQLDLTHVIELACGRGRHSELTAPLASRLTLIDIHPENLQACRERLSGFNNVSFICNDGCGFRPLDDGSVTSIFCYDAMVHFSADLVESYLADTARVMADGGKALFHHSNYTGDPTQHYGLNPCARNLMSLEQFAGLATAAGLEVVQSRTLDWGGIANLDGLTLLRKPLPAVTPARATPPR